MSSAERVQCIAALAVLLASASAQASPELARKHACMGCHAVDQKVVGPAFAEVGQRYAKTPAAVELLSKTIRSGSKGAWGDMPMPPQPQLSAEDAEALARWVMSAAQTPK
jgi:cytochrome c